MQCNTHREIYLTIRERGNLSLPAERALIRTRTGCFVHLCAMHEGNKYSIYNCLHPNLKK